MKDLTVLLNEFGEKKPKQKFHKIFGKVKNKNLRAFDLLQEFVNFHFWIVANAFGFGLEQSMAGAGAYQVLFQGVGNRMALPATSYLGAYGGIIPNGFSAYITNILNIKFHFWGTLIIQ